MLKQIIKNQYYNWLEKRQRTNYVIDESKNMRGIQLDVLTAEEKKEVFNLWNPVVPKEFTLYHRMFKTLSHFDARFVSDEYYYPVLLHRLNPMDMARAFENKSVYSLLFDSIPQPKAIVNCINGTFIVDSVCSTRQDAFNVLRSVPSFIIKPTKDSCQGKNVRLIRPSQDNIEEVVNQYGLNFICQEVVRQSAQTAIFHPSSLNSFRFTTLYINGETSLCTILFRCGQGDSVVDNGGAGGLMVGVSPDGKFFPHAYDKNYGTHLKTRDGVKFDGVVIPEIPSIVKQVLQWHQTLLPHIGIIGWDIALREDNTPVMIEMNLQYPGIQFEQLCSATPLFGDRTEEVIEYM